MENQVELSIVIPVYNSADIFPELYRVLVDSLKKVKDTYEIIAVLDGCSDRSFEVISGYCQSDENVRLIEFSRNFGHQAAISAGLRVARGSMVAVMDDDLEDPPEVLNQLIKKMDEGFDVVYGIRRGRNRSVLHRILFALFYRVLGRLVSLEMPYDAGDFCVLRRSVVDVLDNMPESNRYLRGLRAWSGFRQTGIAYDRGQRFASKSGYSLRKYFALAFDAVFSFSYKPLRFVLTAGTTIALASFVVGVYFAVSKLAGRIADVPGWTSLILSILFFSGIQLISIGIIGEYIARIYDEVKQRPKYIIMRSIGLDVEQASVRFSK